MKRILFFILLLVSVCAQAQVEKVIPDKPNPPRLVNDLASPHLLQDYQRQDLENKLVAYDDSTSNQITIVIVDGLEGYSKEDYAIALGNKWGVGGTKEFNNGVVILISTGKKDGKRSYFIATGYGLEGALPDVTVKSIGDNELVPNLRSGNYYGALNETVDAIIRAAEGRYKAPSGYNNRGKKGLGFFEIMILIFVIFFILVMIAGKGGKNGGMMSRRGYHDWTGPTWFPSSGGGGWTGGGGGSSGGGFGGFGGGSFGGGGAGGDW
jgi:uncharacterized protein